MDQTHIVLFNLLVETDEYDFLGNRTRSKHTCRRRSPVIRVLARQNRTWIHLQLALPDPCPFPIAFLDCELVAVEVARDRPPFGMGILNVCREDRGHRICFAEAAMASASGGRRYAEHMARDLYTNEERHTGRE